jgi:hypothetical protein
MRTHCKNSNLLLIATIAMASVFTGGRAGADEPLRWKFKVGDKLNHTMKQQWASAAIDRGTKKMQAQPTWIQFINDCGPNAQKANKDQSTKAFHEKYKDKPIEWIGHVKSVKSKDKGFDVIINMDPTETDAPWANVKVSVGEALKTQVAALRPDSIVKLSGKLTKLGDAKTSHEAEATAIAPQQAMNTMIDQILEMTWDVRGVDEATGEAVIGLKFDRVKMKMTMPLGTFEYDSKSEAAPTGLGAAIAPMYKALMEGEFEITVTARGEVKDVKIPDSVVEALKGASGATKLGDLATSDGFKKMISKGALVLPKDPPKPGETWNTKVDMNNQSLGKQSLETIYRYEGTKDVGGTKYALIRPELKMEFENPPNAAGSEPQQPPQLRQMPMKVKEQSSDGEVLFDIKQGRLHLAKMRQNVAIEAGGGGEFVDWTIAQRIDVEVTPASEKKAGDVPKAAAGVKKETAKTK